MENETPVTPEDNAVKRVEPVLFLTEKKEWATEIDGFECEIVFWSTESHKTSDHRDIYPHRGIWNSYILIREGQLGDDFKRLVAKVKKVDWGNGQMFDYSKLPVDMENGGLTYYDVFRTPKGKIHAVKIGNDYNHIWNEQQYISEKTILSDLKTAVGKLKEIFPNYLVRSTWDGKYIKPQDRHSYDEDKKKEYFATRSTKESTPPLPAKGDKN